MADAVLQFLLEKLSSSIQRELGLLWGVNKTMKKLWSTLSTIHATLEDAEEKQLNDEAIKNWLRKLKDAAYVVEDILDECKTEALLLEYTGSHSSGLINKVCISFLTSKFHWKNILFRRNIGTRMKAIQERLDQIAQERLNFHLRETGKERQTNMTMEMRQTGSILTEPEVFGREEDRERIVMHLVKNSSDAERLLVYPILGMGGIGKTTLAQLVLKDERVVRHFDLMIWVCVREDFDVKRLIREIIESASGNACEALGLDPLQRRLREKLNGKRYLLVLDDVWSDDQGKWEELKSVLDCGSKGSSIVITTRIVTVAAIMGTIPAHSLSALSEDDCWTLFRQRAFGNNGVENRPNIVAIGKEIVRKCGGVPLAAKTLGSLMRFKVEENEWISVRDSEIWNLPQKESSILPALRLSYNNLPLQLRCCFAYCAVFPKAAVILKEYLMILWMANGFISSNGKLEPEDAFNEAWNELYWRSFFHDVKKNYCGNIVSFRMHDLVHDLAQSVMEDECQVIKDGGSSRSTNITERTRHVTLIPEHLDAIPRDLMKAESLRTLILNQQDKLIFDEAVVRTIFGRSNFCFLRAVDMSSSDMTMLPASISKLKHLRYLDLSDTNIRKLPESLCSLLNLQTLSLNYCYTLQSLPNNLTCLRNLRHLYLKGCHRLTRMPPNIGQLSCLQTLSMFIVGCTGGCHLDELQHLNLRQEIKITHLERVGNLTEAKKANLVGKHNLRSLLLSWQPTHESNKQDFVEQVLEALEPHLNLQCLYIQGYKGNQFPSWMMDPILENLVDITLLGCKNCSQLPPFGQLPSLRKLYIGGMDHVEYVDNYQFHAGGATLIQFPSLECLHIFDFPNLLSISREDARHDLFPHLARLRIEECPKLMTLPACLPSLKEMCVSGCSEVLLGSIANFSSLITLEISNNDDVISFPEGVLRNLNSLKTLWVEDFTKLEKLGDEQDLQGLKSLQELCFQSCDELNSLSDWVCSLTSLKALHLDCCPGLVDLPEGIKSLNSLHVVSISNHPNLVALPDALQHVSALQYLCVWDCPNLASLPNWLGNLTPLRYLLIANCPKLASLPRSVQCLTRLQTLEISGCPELERRCEKGRGEDWAKIAHVPNVLREM
ncbi:putative disease resistance protein RGA3 [Malania oleifera]|uniref:putative disease resistance protein RGA3 n=1 Tax=Malania oleifera TaxID=397392 RepID=UPI0025AE3AB7|nr:putative disease resistance protein RGA3 [Malania oleifera]